MTMTIRSVFRSIFGISFMLGISLIASAAKAANETWAINYGGDKFVSQSGLVYMADQAASDIETGKIDSVNGIQEPELFRTYRVGEFSQKLQLENGVYDLTFHFVEPDSVEVGQRTFDIKAQGEVVMKSVDVRKWRDGNIHAGLSHTVMGVPVDNGELQIDFSKQSGLPVVSALLVQSSSPKSEKWEMVWSDEFDKAGSVDDSKWNIDVWPKGKVNREDQAYTADSRNLRVKDGTLIIEAHKESDGYSSGRIHTMNKADLMYGRVDVRAKLPAGQGTWSAIWMLPSDPYKYASTCKPNEDIHGSQTCNAWPNSGEIDIMEHVGYEMNRVHGTVHTKAYYWVNGQQRKASINGIDVSEDFHVYSLEWTPDRLDVLMDDTVYFTYLNQGEGWQAWPFDHPYHVILNLAIGGDWGRAGGPIDDSIFPVQMLVDYVRLYKPKEEVAAQQR